MKHRKLTKREQEKALIHIVDVLLDDKVPFSGEHRRKQWEVGWGENFRTGDVRPNYFGKYDVNRLNGELVLGLSPDYERRMLYTLVDELGEKYLKNAPRLVEFGCGTGHNLVRLGTINEKAKLVGCDWTVSSQKIVERLGQRFQAYLFDFFHPNRSPDSIITPDSAVYTVAALEQTGTRYTNFVSYLLDKKPSVVVHIEPVPELLDPTKLLDYLSIKYMEKRKYLSGYLDHLRDLEAKGKLKILEARRSGIGSLLIDGYSIIVWQPM